MEYQLQKINFFEVSPIPVCLIAVNTKGFELIVCNPTYDKLFRQIPGKIEKNFIENDLKEYFGQDETESILHSLNTVISTKKEDKISFNAPVEKHIHSKWSVCHTPVFDENGSCSQILQTIVVIEQDEEVKISDEPTKQEISDKNILLEDKVLKRTNQLTSTTQELDDFVYSVSHDLRAPLRRIDGFSQELIESQAEQLDDTGRHYLNRIRQGVQDMGQLIDDLLKLSRISRRKVELEETDLSEMVEQIFTELSDLENRQDVSLTLKGDLSCEADPGLMKIVLSNLLSNAIKYTRNNNKAHIEFGSYNKGKEKVFYIKDNGVGFDPAYSDKLFKAFQRLHSQHEFEGTGIGLVTVKRIISLHAGKIWAEGEPGKGAAFYFTLN